MQDVYQWKKDKKILLYEEGNQIQVQIIRAGRNIQWGVLCRDYQTGGVSWKWEEEIYVAYLNTENALLFDKLSGDGRVVLAAGESFGSIRDIVITELAGEKTQLFVLYRVVEPKTGEEQILAVNPLGERKVQILMHTETRIEHYEIWQQGGVSYLVYKLATEHRPRIFAVDVSRLGDISLTEYILCKEQTMQELTIRCKENDKNFNQALKKMEREYEEKWKENAKTMEKRYKSQYEELSELAKGMQEEGRKWRELYYKSVTKD